MILSLTKIFEYYNLESRTIRFEDIFPDEDFKIVKNDGFYHLESNCRMLDIGNMFNHKFGYYKCIGEFKCNSCDNCELKKYGVLCDLINGNGQHTLYESLEERKKDMPEEIYNATKKYLDTTILVKKFNN